MMRLTLTTALTLAALAAPAWAQAPAGHDHSQSGTPTQAAPTGPAAPPTAAAPQGGMGHMGMMDDMKAMMGRMSAMHDMGMMQMMGMMGRGMAGMATIDRIEGRIAFLRAELKITDTQAESWNGFADALRANAKRLAEARASMLPKPGEAASLTAKLEQQEQWLTARLEGTKAMKSAFARLSESLSDDQKKTANELLAPHMGMGAMATLPMQMPPEKEQGRMHGMGGMGMGSMGMSGMGMGGMGMGKK